MRATEFKDKNGDWICITSDGENIKVMNESKGGSRRYQVGKPGVLEHFELIEIESTEQVLQAYKTGKVWFE